MLTLEQVSRWVRRHFYRKIEFLQTGGSALHEGKPILLDAGGHVDASMINDADVDHGSVGGLGDDDHTQYILADGTRAFTGAQSFGGNDINGVEDINSNATNLFFGAVNTLYDSSATSGTFRFRISGPTQIGQVFWNASELRFQTTPAAAVFTIYTNAAERMRVDASGNIGIGATAASGIKLDVNGNSIRIRTAKTPASASDTGTQGQIAWDGNFLYVCVAPNTWKRVGISTW